MLGERRLPKQLKSNYQQNSKYSVHSVVPISVERSMQRLQELDVEKREPILLRCSALQHARFIHRKSLQQMPEIYNVFHEFHTAVTQSMFRLAPSLETDELPIRYAYASLSGRSTTVQLRSSPVYTVYRHIIPSSKEIQVKRRTMVTRLSIESIIRPMEMIRAERWHMNWEYVVYRVSHGLHFAIMKNIADMNPQHPIIHIRIQKAYSRRFIRCNIAPIQKKKILKASEPYPIIMCTADRGEPCHVRKINILRYHQSVTSISQATSEHTGGCSYSSAPIGCSFCYDTVE